MMRLVLMVALFAGCVTAYAADRASGPCANVPHADHPMAVLSNGEVKVVLFLPDAQSGYYRAGRFDWSGVIACASYNGHTYFGEWFKRYDPLLHDSITGPVEEFRTEDGAIGFAQAAPGGLFVKPGVGVLRKVGDGPYKFGFLYPLVDSGVWTVRKRHLAVTFQQRLQGPNGVAYVYTKTVALEEKGSAIILKHSLKNIGRVPLMTDVYDHDFFMLDGRPTGKGLVVRLPFVPRVVPSPDNVGDAAEIRGKEIVYTRELAEGETFASYLSGYSAEASDYDVTVEDRDTGIGVEQTSLSPIVKMYLWSIRSTVCPEAYIHLDVPSGKTEGWTIRYRLFGPAGAKVTAAEPQAPHPS